MKIQVQDVQTTTPPRVQFTSELGGGEAAWLGDPPAAGQEYSVELAVGERLVWGEGIAAAEAASHAVTFADDGVELSASLEGIDDDGVATLRLGPSLVLVETEGTPPPVGTPVRVKLGELVLADTGI
jgi:hypothetical protein